MCEQYVTFYKVIKVFFLHMIIIVFKISPLMPA